MNFISIIMIIIIKIITNDGKKVETSTSTK